MSLEIENLAHIGYLVKYAIGTNNEEICKDIDLQVLIWLSDVGSIHFSHQIVNIVKEAIAQNKTQLSWWENINNPELLKDHKPEPTHTDFKQMLRDMYEFSKEDDNTEILAADDPKHSLIGYVMCKEGGEIAKQFTINIHDAVKTMPDDKFKNQKYRCSLHDKSILKKYASEELDGDED